MSSENNTTGNGGTVRPRSRARVRAGGRGSSLVLAAFLGLAPPSVDGEASSTVAGPGDDPELALTWVDVSGMPAGSLTAAIEEARRLLEPTGIRVAARQERAGVPITAGSVIVLYVRDRRSDGSKTLWGAAPADGDRAVWVYPERVASAVGLDPAVPHAWSAAADIRFRRLLGAVVAHELLHRLAGAPHAEEGVMAATLSPADAVSAFRVEAELHAPLREGVARVSAGLPLPALTSD